VLTTPTTTQRTTTTGLYHLSIAVIFIRYLVFVSTTALGLREAIIYSILLYMPLEMTLRVTMNQRLN